MDFDLDDLSTYGLKFIVEPSRSELTDSERRILSELRPAGVMLRSRNFLQNSSSYTEWLTHYRSLIEEIRSLINRPNLIVSIDHEGGRVIRPPMPITRFPYAARYAQSAGEVARAMAIELRSLGVNLSFAPVADIHSNPNNPVINQRAFGRTPEEVTGPVVTFANELRRFGVEPCAKHFPGHGDTSTDSHFALPVLPYDRAALKERELIPFIALIKSEIRFIMTAHLMLPAIDPLHPATFSSAILTTLLRDELGFSGVTIADAMGMKAVVDSLQDPRTTATAVNAGLDMYCVAGDSVSLETALTWANFMRDGVRLGTIAPETIHRSVTRIVHTLTTLSCHPVTELSGETLSEHAALATRLQQCGEWGEQFTLSLPGFE